MARVVAAHDALQLRKFAHHVGEQVGLGELRGGVGALRQHITTELLADGTRNGAHTLRALALRAQLVVIDHLAQAFNTRSQRLLAVLIEEELGVGQARAHHAFVAADHRARIARADVADDQEFVRQFSLRVEQRKVFLVRLHREDQAFLRHAEELRLEFADEHVRSLDQCSHLFEQRVVFNGLATAAHLRSSGCQLACDLGLAFGERGDHRAVTLQRDRVAVGVLQHHRRHGRFKAVAVRRVARSQPQRLHGHHGAAVQGHQPVRRAHEVHAGPAGQFAVGLQLVAHDLGDGQLGERFVQRLLQASGQRDPGRHALVKQRLGLAVGRALEAGHGRRIGTERRQALEQRGGRLAAGVQAHAHRHELLRHRLVLGASQHAGDVRGQAAW